MKNLIFVILFLSSLSNASYFYADDFRLTINLSKGYALDGGDLPWYISFCSENSIYYCANIPGYLMVAVPKKKIKVGDHWYFSGVKFLYAGKTKDNKMLIVSQKSEAILKSYSDACASCLDVIMVKDQMAVSSVLSIYSEDIQKETIEWRYSDGDFYLNKIPKGFPAGQVYSSEVVDNLSRRDWTPEQL